MQDKWSKAVDAEFDILPIYPNVGKMILEADRDTSNFPAVGDSKAIQEFLMVHGSEYMTIADYIDGTSEFVDMEGKDISFDYHAKSFTQDAGITDKATALEHFQNAMIAISLPVVDVLSTAVIPASIDLMDVSTYVTPAAFITAHERVSGITGLVDGAAWDTVFGATLIMDFSEVSKYRDSNATGVIIEQAAVDAIAALTV